MDEIVDIALTEKQLLYLQLLLLRKDLRNPDLDEELKEKITDGLDRLPHRKYQK